MWLNQRFYLICLHICWGNKAAEEEREGVGDGEGGSGVWRRECWGERGEVIAGMREVQYLHLKPREQVIDYSVYSKFSALIYSKHNQRWQFYNLKKRTNTTQITLAYRVIANFKSSMSKCKLCHLCYGWLKYKKWVQINKTCGETNKSQKIIQKTDR